MPADLFDRFTAPAVESRFAPDAAFAARPRLVELRNALSQQLRYPQMICGSLLRPWKQSVASRYTPCG